MPRENSYQEPATSVQREAKVATTNQSHADGDRRSSKTFPYKARKSIHGLLYSGNPVVEKLLSLDKLRELYHSVREPDSSNIFNRILKKMSVVCSVSEADIARVPTTGATIVAANHPFGILDGILLGALLLKIRPDLKILTNYLLTGIPELDDYCIPLDPFGERKLSAIGSYLSAKARSTVGSEDPAVLAPSGARPEKVASDHEIVGSGEMNQRGLRAAVDWLRRGGMLLVFPAGEVSHLQWSKGVTDPQWNTTAFRLAQRTQAQILPVFIDGRNSVPFQLVGLVHPRLRTARLPKEFLQKRGARIELRIGKVEKKLAGANCQRPAEILPGAKSRKLAAASNGTEWLRWKTYILANRGSKPSSKVPKVPQIPFLSAARLPDIRFLGAHEALESAVPAAVLEREIAQLARQACLESTEEYDVYCANAPQIPHLLREIGRLRELTFRKEGEGTGKAVDLDRFDDYCLHLFLWNKAAREVVGAYRLAKTADVLPRFGAQGLYTNTLFRYKREFFERLGRAVELGRSFVRPEYQRQYAPLLLLWKAIGRFVALHADHPVLFGAVSISNSYAPASRELMYQFFKAQFSAHPLSALVQPRHPFRSGRLKHWDVRAFQHLVRDAEELSGSVSEFEFDAKGIPILLKQYLRVGGQVLAFNVDGRFSDVLDGLIVVDLRTTHRRSLQRYLGTEGLERFLRFHESKR